MARKSKLTDAQWEEVLERHLAGEKIRPLSREYGVSESAIRQQITAQAQKIKSVAKQVVSAECAVKALPISAQVQVRNYAERLRAISNHMTSAAEYGAATAHRLAQIANKQTDQIDEVSPESSIETVKTVAFLTKTANEAALLGMSLAKFSAEYGFENGGDDAKKIALLSDEQLYAIATGGG